MSKDEASQVHGSRAGSNFSEDTDRSVYSSGPSSLKYASSISSTSSDADQEHEHKSEQGSKLEYTQESSVDTNRSSSSHDVALDKSKRHPRLVCLDPGCTSDATFWRAGDLARHYRTVHRANLERFDCPQLRCSRKGDHAFARKDHLIEHLRSYHGQNLPKNSNRAGNSSKRKLLKALSETSWESGDDTTSDSTVPQDTDEDLQISLEDSFIKYDESILQHHHAASVVRNSMSNLSLLMSAAGGGHGGFEIASSQASSVAGRSRISASVEDTPGLPLWTWCPEEGLFDMDQDNVDRDPTVLPVETNKHQDVHTGELDPTVDAELADSTPVVTYLGINKIRPDDSKADTEFAQLPAQHIDSRNTDKTRRFNVLPRNHMALAEWKVILSLIRRHYSEIMGPQNMGSVELLAQGDTPTVCVTCQYPGRLQRTRLEDIIRPLGFPYLIGEGYIQRSGGDENYLDGADSTSSDATGTCNQLARAFQFGPALYGHHMLRPDCGASIGVQGLAALEAARVSLGGYVELRYGERWERYALTSHHLLHIEDEDAGSADCLEGRLAASKCFREPTPGVCNGIYTVHGRATAVDIRSSAKRDYENELSRLLERTRTMGRNRRCGNVEHGNLIKAAYSLESSPSRFGEAIHSSGLCIAEDLDLQMDWLLIGNLTANRIGANTVGDTSPFMEGRQWLRDGATEAETAVISQQDFDDLMSYCSELDPNQIGGLSRIHGRGCESGLADGHLSRWPVLATVGGMKPSFEWCFAPRNGVGLGVSGDSGAWIFTETGALLGQILGYNPFTQMTYYTPIWALFDHIKRVTGASEVRLPPKTMTSASDSGYESSTLTNSTMPEKPGV